MRLDKYLSDMGKGSRKEIKEKIRNGRVSVNGSFIKNPDFSVSKQDQVLLDGEQISYVSMEYYMLYKPSGILTATVDKRMPTVLDLLKEKKRNDLFPVGRLDKDTEGLILITNDGDMAHRLLSPKRHVAKCYFVRVDGPLSDSCIRAFQEGVSIGETKPTKPAKLVILFSSKEYSEAKLTIYEGRFHQIKRMFQTVGRTVTYLKRLSMGSLFLDETLEKGCSRPLTKEELQALYQEIGRETV